MQGITEIITYFKESKLKTLLVLIAVLLAFLAGMLIRPPAVTEIIEAKQEINEVIIDYLHGSLNQDWDKVLSLLQGEALINAKANIGSYKRAASLVETEMLSHAAAGQYEIVDVRAITAVFATDGDELDEVNYRFYIEDNKIFKVEPITPIYDGSFTIADRLAELTVSKYLELIEQNDWDTTLRLLTGEAKSIGQRTASRMPELAVSFDNLMLSTVGENKITSLVEAQYIANDTPIKALFILKNIRDTWLIERIIIVEE